MLLSFLCVLPRTKGRRKHPSALLPSRVDFRNSDIRPIWEWCLRLRGPRLK